MCPGRATGNGQRRWSRLDAGSALKSHRVKVPLTMDSVCLALANLQCLVADLASRAPDTSHALVGLSRQWKVALLMGLDRTTFWSDAVSDTRNL